MINDTDFFHTISYVVESPKVARPYTSIVFHSEELNALKKVLMDNPPAKVKLDGAERYFYRRVLTKLTGKDYSFPDTDDA